MSNKRHTLKTFVPAVMVALAISAFAVSSASAANWLVGGSTLANGSSQNVTATQKTGTTATLEGELLGQQFVLTGTTLSSAGWGGVGSATINQSGSSAKATGRASFSGLTVDKPSGCTVTSPIVTKDLTAEAVAHGETSRVYVKFFPEEGETIATIVVKNCAVAGSYPVKGVVYGEGNEWGNESVNQSLVFSPAINETLKGALTLGTKPAKLTAENTNHLASGVAFGAEK